MKLKPLLFLTLAVLAIYSNTYATGDVRSAFIKKDVANAKKLVILINDITPNMDDANKQFEDAVRKYWSATSVEFTTEKATVANKMKTDNVYIGLVRKNQNSFNDSPSPKANGNLVVTFLVNNGSGKLVTNNTHADVQLYADPTELEIISAVLTLNDFATQQIKGVYDNATHVKTGGIRPDFYKLSTRNKKELKNKTVLVDESMLGKKTSEADLKGGYHGKLKVVSQQEILGYIKDKSPDYAYVISARGNSEDPPGSGFLVFDTQNGTVLSYAVNSSKVVMMVGKAERAKLDAKAIEAVEQNSK